MERLTYWNNKEKGSALPVETDDGLDTVDLETICAKLAAYEDSGLGPEELQKYKDAIDRQGKFGQLFVEYKGCPRGSVGRAACPLEDEVILMPAIEDVDGGKWVPVNDDALHELVDQYLVLKEKYKLMQEGRNKNE